MLTSSALGRAASAGIVAAAIVSAAPRAWSETGQDTDGGGPARIGEGRPALEVATLDGGLVNAARVAGRILIVDFFATWCEPCHRALPALLAARAAASPNALLVLVDVEEPPNVVRSWAARAGLPPDAIVAVDPIGAAFRRWGARKLPTTFVVDGSGVVRRINHGFGPGYRDRLTRWLGALAAGH